MNNEEVDDIDLATNLEPNEVSEVLMKNQIDYYETGIKHGTITAIIDDKKFENQVVVPPQLNFGDFAFLHHCVPL